MKTTIPLHTDHQLDQLAGQFEQWRQTRTHRSERIPQALWDYAVALATTLPPARVAKQLRLRLGDLKKQMGHRAVVPAVTPLARSFVEVPPAPAKPLPPTALLIELSRADGTRLCLSTPASSSLPLDAVVRAFVEGRSCCN